MYNEDNDYWLSAKKKQTIENSTVAGESANHSDSKNRIESINNDIYFYAEVTRTNNLTLNKKLDSLGMKYLKYLSILLLMVVPLLRLL